TSSDGSRTCVAREPRRRGNAPAQAAYRYLGSCCNGLRLNNPAASGMSIRTQARPGQITRVIRLATPRSDAGRQGVHLVQEALGAGGEGSELGIFGLAIGEGGRV